MFLWSFLLSTPSGCVLAALLLCYLCHANCVQDKLQEQFSYVRHATLLYNAHLVYTNLPLDDMRLPPFIMPLVDKAKR